MALPISDEAAKQFASALVSHGGNQSAAAQACGYKPGNPARCAGRDLARNPAVLKHLRPMVIQHLSALTPRAIQTLAGLLTNKSGYIRLEAAKDILNRNGVGLAHAPGAASGFSVHIQIGNQVVVTSGRPAGETFENSLGHEIEPGGRKLDTDEVTRSPAHDFPEKASQELPPAHDFSPKVSPARVSEVLDVEPESIPGIENHGSVEDLDL
jgi:hypothetical protein